MNDVSLPVRVNNAGVDERNLKGASLKADFETGIGTITSITAFDHIDELLTGDQFDFLPDPRVGALQVLRGGSGAAPVPRCRRLEPGGAPRFDDRRQAAHDRGRAYYIKTDRFISTGNVFDLGTGVVPRVEAHAAADLQSAVHVPRGLAEQRRVGGVRRRDV